MVQRLMTAVWAAALTAVFALAAPVAAGAAEEVLVESALSGKSGHNTTGRVTVTKSGASMKVTLGSDFRLDGAPDPVVGFGSTGDFDSEAKLSDLESNSGEQSYKIPDSIDPTVYNQFYIWCERFNVPLGVAGLAWPEEEEDAKEATTN